MRKSHEPDPKADVIVREAHLSLGVAAQVRESHEHGPGGAANVRKAHERFAKQTQMKEIHEPRMAVRLACARTSPQMRWHDSSERNAHQRMKGRAGRANDACKMRLASLHDENARAKVLAAIRSKARP